ncbi:type VII secretion integral membrane protein EccD [Rhodococcus kronopolitis]|uniref:Type VII secretion integral membrane protein EccD n=1 Tax=Rhodococcus kronopolitis TaxID=1460226 RepID=A0ABV9FRY1_9NOCA
MNSLDSTGSPAVASTGGNADGNAELCRLTVRTEHTQVDLAVPTEVPVAMLVPGIVDLLDQHNNSTIHYSAATFDESADDSGVTRWALSRIGQEPLAATATLAEHGVRDGEMLLLAAAARSAPPPLFDDLMHNVAAVDAERYRRWDAASARAMGTVVAAAATGTGSAALLVARSDGDGILGALTALAVAVLAATAGAVFSRVYRDHAAAVALVGCALPMSAAGGALLVPGGLGAAHLFLGAATCAAFAVLALRASGVGLALCTGTAAAATLLGAAAGTATLTEQPPHAIGAVLAATALAGLAAAPRLSILLATLPLPPVPSPGAPLESAEFADPAPGGVPAAFVDLEVRTRRARRYLTGLVAAMSLTTVAGALVAARAFSGDGIYWPGTAFAATCAAVLMLRGRGHSSLGPATALIGGGALLLALALTGTAAAGTAPPVAVFALAVLGAGASLTLGMLAPAHSFSPVQRRGVEVLDYAAIAAVVPLACWVSGLFATMRGL